MNKLRRGALGLATIVLIAVGCVGTDTELRYAGKADVQYYKDVATQVDYADVQSNTAHQAQQTEEPRTLRNRRKDKPLKMTLMQAVHTALANNKIIRDNGSFLTRGTSVLNNADNTPSVYDSAIQQTGVLFGRRGVEAALAEFDTTFATSMLWGRSEDVQNNAFFSGGLTPGGTLQQDTAAFRSSLSKRFADGGSFLVGHDWNYRGAALPAQLFNSVYTGNVRAEYRRPLWAASGVEFTRIAGPINPNFSAIAGVSQGVVISRINSDITLAEFEASVRNLVKDVEDVYWDLYLRYQQYHAAVVARENALSIWKTLKTRDELGLPPRRAGVGRTELPQARGEYFRRKAEADTALSELYSTEIRLRRLLGLTVNSEATVIQPIDEPAIGELAPDWNLALSEALTRRVELRKLKWNIKSLELQLKAAKSLTNPRFDFVSSYQVNGFGDSLFGQNDNDGITPQGLASGYETITQGDQTTWGLGFEFSMPLGFRSARAQVRNIELRLLKARQGLAAAELEVSHEMAVAFQNLALFHANIRSNHEQVRAARERLRQFDVLVKDPKIGGIQNADVDLLLRAQSDLATAETAFYSSVTQYNKAIAELQYRKGTLLEYNAVHLAEGQWTPKAYEQALRRARARSHAFDASKLMSTEPLEFVQPPHCPSPGSVVQPPSTEGGDADNAKPNIPPAPPMDGGIKPAPEPKPLPKAGEKTSAPEHPIAKASFQKWAGKTNPTPKRGKEKSAPFPKFGDR